MDITNNNTTESKNTFVRFIFLRAVDEDNSLSNLSPFKFSRALADLFDSCKVVARYRSGGILVESFHANQSEKLLELSQLAGVQITASPHRTLNCSRDVVRCRDLTLCTDEKILTELGPQGVTKTFNITVKDEQSQRKTNSFILTFNSYQLPKHITVGYERIPVSLYIPNPYRCFSCQQFGHSEKNCRNGRVCACCGSSAHSSDQCSGEAKCVNCQGSHPAYSRECPRWIAEKEKLKNWTENRSPSFPLFLPLNGNAPTHHKTATNKHTFPRLIVLEGTDPSKPLGKLSPFLLQKALQSSVGTLNNVKRLQSGAVLAETDSPTYSQKLLALNNIAGAAVKASPHHTLNQSKAVVRCTELRSCLNEKIVEELADQGVIASSNIIKDGNKTNTFILTFCTPAVPEDLHIGYISVPVTPYIPNPLRCFKCQRFGHGEKSCNKEAVCARCAETGHSDKSCERPVFRNCSANQRRPQQCLKILPQ